jgi:hypothetical protein
MKVDAVALALDMLDRHYPRAPVASRRVDADSSRHRSLSDQVRCP